CGCPQPRRQLAQFALERGIRFRVRGSILAQEDTQKAMAAELDMVNRDPNGINQGLQVKFEDVLAEPDGAHSMDCVWSNSYKCYTCGLSLSYKIATLFCGIFIALHWGCTFGCVAFNEIWYMTPNCKLFELQMRCIKRFVTVMLECCFGPCCAACGMFFSNITVTNKSG
ncbi:hypothetical protein BOX15_Mlig006601g2, partial [Macrostomum lignano]